MVKVSRTSLCVHSASSPLWDAAGIRLQCVVMVQMKVDDDDDDDDGDDCLYYYDNHYMIIFFISLHCCLFTVSCVCY